MSAPVNKEIDTDLYSRQIYVLGMETMKQLLKTDVLITGLTGVGVEIAKNVILAGPRSVTLHDHEVATWEDLSANFYLTEEDVKGKVNRAKAVHNKLAELNQYVKVNVFEGELTPEEIHKYTVVVCLNKNQEELIRINKACRGKADRAVGFIAGEVRGLFGYAFVDFGPEFTVLDVNGEEPGRYFINAITQDEKGAVVNVHEESVIGFQDGDFVVLDEIKGMDALNDPEKKNPRKVTVLSPYSFRIEQDTSKFPEYRGCGIVQHIKVAKVIKFKSLEEALKSPGDFVGEDFAKWGRAGQLHVAFQALSLFRKKHGGDVPHPGNQDHAKELITLAKDLNAELKKSSDVFSLEEVDDKVLTKISHGAKGELNPMAAFFGGILGQETLKYWGKFHPIHQFFYFDAEEALPSHYPLPQEDTHLKGTRYDGQIAVFGEKFQQRLLKANVFLVGSGALGCEFLKNYALMGVSAGGGEFHVTDLDTIEKSNLNRQFLFRPKDIGSNKAVAASASANRMNPNFKPKVWTTPVGDSTEDVFTDEFWDSLDVVTNALDNVKARQYTDSKCVLHRKPLLESGTLGTKANTQVVLPLLTESYSSSADPPEKSIPMCTLKNFPNAIEHTIEWARDLFGGYFKNTVEDVNNYLDNPKSYLEQLSKSPITQQKNTLEGIVTQLALKDSITFEKCVEWARLRFEDNFNNSIQQLLHIFPKDHLDNSGQPFWNGPKRAPTPVSFDPKSPLHLDFIEAAANLFASTFKVPSKDRAFIESYAPTVSVPHFSPKSGVKIKANDNDNTEEGADDDDRAVADLLKKLPDAQKYKDFRMEPAIFEKDDDSNFHIAFITAASNLRARNYTIQEADFQATKKIAGRIIPAIATTTAMITGLVCIEFIKYLQGNSLLSQEELNKPLEKQQEKLREKFKNSFCNLALPLFSFAEPLAPKKNKSDPKANTVAFPEGWDLWQTIRLENPDLTISGLNDYFKASGFQVSSIAYEKFLMYSSYMPNHQPRFNKKIADTCVELQKEPFKPHVKWITLAVEVEKVDDENETTVNIPLIRLKVK